LALTTAGFSPASRADPARETPASRASKSAANGFLLPLVWGANRAGGLRSSHADPLAHGRSAALAAIPRSRLGNGREPSSYEDRVGVPREALASVAGAARCAWCEWGVDLRKRQILQTRRPAGLEQATL